MGGLHRLRFFRAKPTKFADARTDLTAPGRHMDKFQRACLRRLHRDPNEFLALLAPAGPDPNTRDLRICRLP